MGQFIDHLYDPGFSAPNVIGGSGAASVSSILVHEDGRYTITGGFQFNAPYNIKKGVQFFNDGSINESFELSGDPLGIGFLQFFQDGFMVRIPNTLVPIDANGNVPPAQFFDLSYVPYKPSAPPNPHAGMYQVLDDDKIMVAGRFSPDTNNLEDRRHLVRVHPDGSPDTSFNPLKCEEPFNTQLYDLYPTLDGKWMVTGQFNFIEGFESPNIARLNADFSVDTTFQSPFPDYTWSVRIIPGSHPQKLRGAIDDQNRVYISRVEPGFAYALLGLKHLRLLDDGTIDSTFQLGELTFLNYFGETGEGGYYPGSIYAIAFEPDGTLIVGGKFRNIEGHPRGNIAKLNQDGSLVTNVFHRQGADTANWQNGSNPDINVPAITSIVRLDNGGLMVGGRFSRYDGHDQWGLVRLLPSPVGVKENASNHYPLTCFPNPAYSQIRVQLPDDINGENLSLQIYSTTSRLMVEKVLPYTIQPEIQIHELPSGTYFLRVISGEFVGMGQFVIIK